MLLLAVFLLAAASVQIHPGGDSVDAPEPVLIDQPVPAGFVWTRFTVSKMKVIVPWDGSDDFKGGEAEYYFLQVAVGGT